MILRKQQNEEYITTRSSYQELMKKRADIERKLKEAEKAIGEAVGARGDWHDNAAYDAAVEAVRYWASRLQKVDTLLRQLKVLEDEETGDSDRIQVGSKVQISLGGEEIIVKIGGKMEGALREGGISYDSPLGQALINAREGDVVSYKAPGGTMEVHILKILKD